MKKFTYHRRSLVIIFGFVIGLVLSIFVTNNIKSAKASVDSDAMSAPAKAEINLRDTYFIPAGWSLKQFKNYQYVSGSWVERTATYSKIYNRGNPTACQGCNTLVRWDFINTRTTDLSTYYYWSLNNAENLAFYFREGYDNTLLRNVIYAPGHYTVNWASGNPSTSTNPPSNADTVLNNNNIGIKSSIHKSGNCWGWDTNCNDRRPYIYMPVMWDFFWGGNFHIDYKFGFGTIQNSNTLCTGNPVPLPDQVINWYVTVCQFNDDLSTGLPNCEGVTGNYPVANPAKKADYMQGDMIVVYQHEYAAGHWDVYERWYFKNGVGLVAIDRWSPDDRIWLYTGLYSQQ